MLNALLLHFCIVYSCAVSSLAAWRCTAVSSFVPCCAALRCPFQRNDGQYIDTSVNRVGLCTFSTDDMYSCASPLLADDIPFVISRAVDITFCREKKKVVVAIRGTQSIADLVTDAVVHPEPMESWVPPVGVFLGFPIKFCFCPLSL